MSILLVFFTKLSFILFMIRCFFLLIHFLVVEYYGLLKSTSHILSHILPLSQEYVRIHLDPSLFFNFNCLPDDDLCKIVIWADDTALNSSFYKLSDLPQQAQMAYELYNKLYIDIWEIILYLQAKPYRLKTKILIASFLLAPLLNN